MYQALFSGLRILQEIIKKFLPSRYLDYGQGEKEKDNTKKTSKDFIFCVRKLLKLERKLKKGGGRLAPKPSWDGQQ